MTTRELIEKRKIARPDTARPGQLRPTRKRLAQAILSWNPKGGVSKSSTLAALAYLLMCSGSRPRVIDTDVSNPDLWKSHERVLPCECLSLEDEGGFVSIARRLTDPDIDEEILISCGAGLVETFMENAPILDLAAKRLERPMVVLSPIDPDIDSCNHLPDLLEAMPNATVFVVRPRHFGRPESFRAFNESKLGQAMIADNRVIDLPAIPEAIMRRFKSQRLSFAEIAALGDEAETAALDIWSPRAEAALAPLLNG
ncbi:MAG: hypothetical protein Q8R85_06100 [Bosea sp. (in: a-proteobacteria)]|jgi:hypothetical protein|uniref:hypothetical protein n=1 Tax=Hyphomicrobiales TaxID=356 RepID=UPI00082BF023|nr:MULTISPECIES: hypothetical protein [Hyphomicrobiales]MDP3600728.1 hypothetical protein [Bosea sp. (in: a-proteobacteria)]